VREADLGPASWNPIVGRIQEAAFRSGRPGESELVGCALLLAEAGLPASWRICPKTPLGVAFAGRWFRCEGSLALVSDGEQLRIDVDGVTWQFRRSGGQWGADLQACEAIPGRTTPLVLSSGMSDVQRILHEWPLCPVEPASSHDIAAVQAALTLLETHAPEYAAWVRNGAQAVVVIEPSGSMLFGGSASSRPGLAIVSRAKPIELADELVHEATHQYMFTLTILDELHDGTDRCEYHSPLRRQLRPFGGILAAYHVICNLVMMYERITASGYAERAECEAKLEDARAALRATDPIVCNNPSLTPLGAMMCRMLRDRVGHVLS
jgi:HEXXH motif-containing protein